MASGGRQQGRAVRVLWVLALSLCALFSQPALAQNDTATATPGSSEAGRVPVYGVPPGLGDALKVLQRDEPVPTTLFEARRQAERSAAVAATFLESEGYYQAETEVFAEGQNLFTRGVRVTPGPLFVYGGRKIAYLGEAPDATTQAELETLLAPLDDGAPARAQPVIETGDALIARLKQAGYPDAGADPVDALADAQAGTIELEFRVRPGRRASFGSMSVSGLEATQKDFILSLRPWKDGEQVTPARMDEFRARLAETGLFATTAVKLGETGQANAQGGETRDVQVEVTERERRTIALGASASTSDGFGLDAQWQLRNWSGWGDSVTLAGQLATLQRRVSATYRLPHIGKYGRILSLNTEIEDFETDAFDQTGANIGATLEEQLSPRVRASLGVEAGFASILDSQARSDGTGPRDLYIISGTGTAEYVGVRDILDPVNGIRARVQIEPGVTMGDTNIGFTRFNGEASFYWDLGTENLVAALRARAGTIAGPNGVPPDRLFFAGGGGSVRGYEYQSLSPRDLNTNQLIGGRSLAEVSAELRYRWSDTLGAVAFIDAGSAFDPAASTAVIAPNITPNIDEGRVGVGAGIGARYYTAFGPLRLDLAVPLNKREGDADFQIYISIGQAF